MTLEQMQYALEVYHCDSISKAAKKLFMSQSNLSTILVRMESELGFPLFLRSNKGIQLTEQGARFLRYASLVCANYEETLSSIRRTDFRRLRIAGIHYPPCRDAFIKLCADYENSSKLHFSFTYPSRQMALEKLSMAQLDLVIQQLRPDAVSTLERTAKELGLTIIQKKRIPIVLRLGPSHPLYHKECVQLSDFQEQTFVDYSQNPFLKDPRINAQIKLDPDRVVNIADSTLRIQLVSRTSIISIGSKLPSHINEQYQIRSIPLENVEYEMVALVQEGRNLPEEVTRYLDFLNEELETL